MGTRWSTLLAALIGLAVFAAACGNGTGEQPGGDDESPQAGSTEEGEAVAEQAPGLCTDEYQGLEAPDDFNVGLVTDIGTVSDNTFNEFAFDGMKAAEECFGIETSYIETASEADYEQNLQAILTDEPEVVISVGFLLASATMAVAQENPDVRFIGVDQFQEEYPDNYVGILFREDEGGFLAGVMAALLTESGVVGVVAGREDVPPVVRFVNAYRKGVEHIDDSVQVLEAYHQSFTDAAAGQSTARQMIGEGADVIFGAGGLTGSGGIRAAAQQDVWVIGVDQDEYFSTFGGGDTAGAEYLATSAVKRVDLGVFEQIAAAISGDFSGGIFQLTVKNDGITYAPPHDADIPEEVLKRLEEVRQGLADGSISTGVDPVTGELLP